MTQSPQREFAVDVVRRLRDAGFEALWAGGCVRDLLLDRKPGDYDVATNATPDEVRKVFGKKRTLAVGASFGVIVVLGPPAAGQIEVATFRTEGTYADGRRPDSVTFSTPEEDAQRRDFTINGMFFDPIAEEIHDFVGGESDLRARVLRAIGDPHERMTEDKLRLLRAIRFAATLDFQIEPTTLAAVSEMADQITVVSAERIAHELKRMLVDNNRRVAMELAAQTGLLRVIVPQLAPVLEDLGQWRQTLGMLDTLACNEFATAFAALLDPLRAIDEVQASENARRICRGLKLSNAETDATVWLIESQTSLSEASSLSLAQLKRRLAVPLVNELLAMMTARVKVTNTGQQNLKFCKNYLRNTPAAEINPPPLVTGDDLIKSGLKPGKAFKQILDEVRDAQLNGDISHPDQALKLAQSLVT